MLVPLNAAFRPLSFPPVPVENETCLLTTDTIGDLARAHFTDSRTPYYLAYFQDDEETSSFCDAKRFIAFIESGQTLHFTSRRTIFKVSYFALLKLNENFHYLFSHNPKLEENLKLAKELMFSGNNMEDVPAQMLCRLEPFYAKAASEGFETLKYVYISLLKDRYEEALSLFFRSVSNQSDAFVPFFNFLLYKHGHQSIEPSIKRCLLALDQLGNESNCDVLEKFLLNIYYSNKTKEFSFITKRDEAIIKSLEKIKLPSASFLLGLILEGSHPAQAAAAYLDGLQKLVNMTIDRYDLETYLYEIPIRFLYLFCEKGAGDGQKFKQWLIDCEEKSKELFNPYNYLLIEALMADPDSLLPILTKLEGDTDPSSKNIYFFLSGSKKQMTQIDTPHQKGLLAIARGKKAAPLEAEYQLDFSEHDYADFFARILLRRHK